jgi:hypothetical protein
MGQSVAGVSSAVPAKMLAEKTESQATSTKIRQKLAFLFISLLLSGERYR